MEMDRFMCIFIEIGMVIVCKGPPSSLSPSCLDFYIHSFLSPFPVIGPGKDAASPVSGCLLSLFLLFPFLFYLMLPPSHPMALLPCWIDEPHRDRERVCVSNSCI